MEENTLNYWLIEALKRISNATAEDGIADLQTIADEALAKRFSYPASPVEGEKEEPREREFRITKNYEDGTSEVTCLRINGEKWVEESEQASRIKALEERLKLADDLMEQRGNITENWRRYQDLKKIKH